MRLKPIATNGQIYSAADIIGKTLIPKVEVLVKRLPRDSDPYIYKVKAGQTIGVVYSYLEPSMDRKSLYWMFKDEFGKPYYVEHGDGKFSIKALREQGAVSTWEKIQAEQEANQPLTTTIKDTVIKLAWIGAAAFVIIKVLPGLISKK
jgi:hypothetical protein